MSTKTRKIISWSLVAVVASLFLMSASMKFKQDEATLNMAAAYGIDATTYLLIGIIEVASLVLFIIPRTGILGTLLLASYMGGAIVTHLEHHEPVTMAVMVQTLVWITAFVRFPELKQRLFLTTKPIES